MTRRTELHDLDCTGPGVGCLCERPKFSVLTAEVPKPLDIHPLHMGVDMHLSSLQSLLMGLEQRSLDSDQLDRFARLLQYGEQTVMGRVKVRR